MAFPKVNPFEKSKKDKETKGKGKEGSKKEETFDRFQAKAAPKRAPMAPPMAPPTQAFKCGGVVGKKK